jgi:hypothetical protein
MGQIPIPSPCHSELVEESIEPPAPQHPANLRFTIQNSMFVIRYSTSSLVCIPHSVSCILSSEFYLLSTPPPRPNLKSEIVNLKSIFSPPIQSQIPADRHSLINIAVGTDAPLQKTSPSPK